MSKNKDESKDKIINKLYESYKDYHEYFTIDYFQQQYNTIMKSYDYMCGLNPELYYSYNMMRIIDYRIIKLILNGDYKLESLFVNKYYNVACYLINKLDIKNLTPEDAIIEAVLTYDGKDMFSREILKVVRNKKGNVRTR